MGNRDVRVADAAWLFTRIGPNHGILKAVSSPPEALKDDLRNEVYRI